MPNLLKICASWALILMGPLAVATSPPKFPYEVLIVKSKRLLIVKKGSRFIKKYQVALGQGGAGDKRVEGDKHTPEGKYKVVGLRPSHKFYYFIQLNYPNRQDALAGYKKGLISWEELVRIYQAHQQKNGIPLQRTRLGGFIGIHGLGKETPQKLLIQRNINWTQGCIALTNAAMDELRQFIRLGTPVTIFNKIGADLLTDIDAVLNIPRAD